MKSAGSAGTPARSSALGGTRTSRLCVGRSHIARGTSKALDVHSSGRIEVSGVPVDLIASTNPGQRDLDGFGAILPILR